jgi:hypothetical protein
VRRRLAILATLAATALLPGCADTQPIVNSSCQAEGAGLCVDIVSATTNIVAEDLCTLFLGTGFLFASGVHCPAAGIVGSCTLTPTDASIVVQYYGPSFTSATAATDCAARGGTFQAPPGPT